MMSWLRDRDVTRNLKTALRPQDLERLRILRTCVAALRGTFQRPRVKRYPIPIARLRGTIAEAGIGSGDVLHVQSSCSQLFRGSAAPTEESSLSQLAYARRVVQMLMDVVGPTGTLTMNTDFARPSGWLKRLSSGKELADDVFDPVTSISRRGIISEAFRRRPDTIRSPHPYYNITAWGRLAGELIAERHLSSPYAQDHHSPWYKLNLVGGKVLLLGRTFEINSLVHLVEYLHPDEFPRPVFMRQPVSMPYLADGRALRRMDVLLHVSGAPGSEFFVIEALPRFSHYLNEKYHIYFIARFADDCEIVVYDAKAQYGAYYQEMKANVTWVRPRLPASGLMADGYLYYAGMASDRVTEQIGVAVSHDGVNFARYEGHGLVVKDRSPNGMAKRAGVQSGRHSSSRGMADVLSWCSLRRSWQRSGTCDWAGPFSRRPHVGMRGRADSAAGTDARLFPPAGRDRSDRRD